MHDGNFKGINHAGQPEVQCQITVVSTINT